MRRSWLRLSFACLVCGTGFSQEKSVKPGINDPFQNPDVEKFQKTFEGESREVFVNREKVVAACGIEPGEIVADVGAGTGLFTRLFAKTVGADGQVYAVDIAVKFLEHVQKTSREAGFKNVSPVLCNFDAVDLPPRSVDVAFVCDTYHHFEFPQRTLASLHRAIKPGGKLIVVDFNRIPGKSSEWTLNHVRAGQDVVEKEIGEAGFKKSKEVKGLLKENYMMIFTKPKALETPKKANAISPLVPGYGGVVPLPNAVEQPAKGSKVVFDIEAASDSTKFPPGLERAATLMNLTGAIGLNAADLEVVVVLHGNATAVALNDEAYKAATGLQNPAGDLIAKLQAVGVKFLVCGQSLERKSFAPKDLRTGVSVAASAATAVINLQNRGFAVITSH